MTRAKRDKQIPKALKVTTTAVIPKKHRSYNPAQYRVLGISSVHTKVVQHS